MQCHYLINNLRINSSTYTCLFIGCEYHASISWPFVFVFTYKKGITLELYDQLDQLFSPFIFPHFFFIFLSPNHLLLIYSLALHPNSNNLTFQLFRIHMFSICCKYYSKCETGNVLPAIQVFNLIQLSLSFIVILLPFWHILIINSSHIYTDITN